MNPTSLSFDNTEDNTGKTIEVTSTGDVTAQSSESWLTVTVAEKIVTVKVSANSGSVRRGHVTVLADDKAATIEVTQAGV